MRYRKRLKAAWDIYRHVAAAKTLLDSIGVYKFIVLGVSVVIAGASAIWFRLSPLWAVMVCLVGIALLLFISGLAVAFYKVGRVAPILPTNDTKASVLKLSDMLIAVGIVIATLIVVGIISTWPHKAVVDSVRGEKSIMTETNEGPKVLMKYEWRGNNDAEGIELINDGTESALNVQIVEVQNGNWAAQFEPVPIIEKGQHVIVAPSSVLALSPHRHPVGKPQFGAFLRLVFTDKRIKDDPPYVGIGIIFQSASIKEEFQSHYGIEYSRSKKKATLRYIGVGKMDKVTER